MLNLVLIAYNSEARTLRVTLLHLIEDQYKNAANIRGKVFIISKEHVSRYNQFKSILIQLNKLQALG